MCEATRYGGWYLRSKPSGLCDPCPFCWLHGAPLRFVPQPQEVAWDVCGRTGYSAKVVYLTVNSGMCSASANALVSTTSPVSSADEDTACELPGGNSCTALTAEVRGWRRYVSEIGVAKSCRRSCENPKCLFEWGCIKELGEPDW